MACMDFVPANTGDGGMFSSPVFAPFSSLLPIVNDWLQRNSQNRILCCETLTLKSKTSGSHKFDSAWSQCTDHEEVSSDSGTDYYGTNQLKALRTCVDSANQWLAQNAQARVLSAETITLTGMYGSRYEFHSELSTSTDHYVRRSGKSSHTYGACTLKGVRIWYLPDNQGPPQRLMYQTLVPTCLDTSGKPTYEDFDATVAKYNQGVQYSSPQGFVLNMETVKQPCGTSGKMDPERTCYQHKSYGLNLIRIWFVTGDIAVPEEIGCADFVPQKVRVNEESVLEDLRVLFSRAQSWLQSQGGIRFTNAQTLHLKYKSDQIDSKRPLSHYWVRTEMIQFLRIWFVKPLGNMPIPRPPMLTYITIDPAKAQTGGAKEMKYETIHQMVTRYNSWLMQCGARPVGIQTFPVPCKIGSQTYPPDQGRHVLKMNSRYHMRVYFDGEFRPPWPGSVPNPPPVTDAGCTLL